MNPILKYGIGLLLLGVVGYNSVYIKKLDEVKTAGMSEVGKFNALQYAANFWTNQLLPAAPRSATDLLTLLPLLQTDKEKAFTIYSHALGIGNIRYFLVKGEGAVTTMGENDITITLPTGKPVHIATEYIFGNATRDASGIIKITDFENTTDLNNVSAELNELIRKQVIPTLKTNTKPGQKLTFIGAMELNQAHLHLDELMIIPIKTMER